MNLVRSLLICLFCLITLQANQASAAGIKLSFRSAPTVNVVWILDQMSGWDPAQTSAEYQAYWKAKLNLTHEDLQILQRYADIRRKQTPRKQAAELQLIESDDLKKADQFMMAFLLAPGFKMALNTLVMEPKDREELYKAIRHFGMRLGKAEWSKETAHLKKFTDLANALVMMGTPTFLGQIRDFLGVTKPVSEISVEVVWAPPTMKAVVPRRVGFHIILPIPAPLFTSDESVPVHLATVVQAIFKYFMAQIPDADKRAVSRLVLSRGGLVVPTQPDLLLEATGVAMGKILFLKRNFPGISAGAVLYPYDPSLRYPYAVDLLARRVAPLLEQRIGSSGAFFPDYITAALDTQIQLFPPSPRDFARFGYLMASPETQALFVALFGDKTRTFSFRQDRDFQDAIRDGKRPSMMIALHKEFGPLNKVFKGLGFRPNSIPPFRKYQRRRVSVLMPVKRSKGFAPMFVIYARNKSDLRELLVHLHRLDRMPDSPIELKK